MESSQLTRSSTPDSSPSSYFSELASASSRSNEDLTAHNHILAISAPRGSLNELQAYLRSLHFEQNGSKSYLLLALNHEGVATPTQKSIDQVIDFMGRILGDGAMFKPASQGVNLDKIILPPTKVAVIHPL